MKISEASEKEGKKIELKGWIYRHRVGKRNIFIILRDSSGKIQCVFKKGKVGKETFKRASNLKVESSVKIKGKVIKDKRAPGGIEVEGENLEVIHLAKRFPITKDKSTEFLLDVRHLWLRSEKITSVLKIKNEVLKTSRKWLDENGFYEVNPPIITSSACEGGATLFELEYFGEEAYLSQSAQLYLEALIYSLEKVYALTPSFRAEKSRTRRHLMEYWHLEPEAAWVDHEENMKIQEKLISYVCKKVGTTCKDELKKLGRNPKDLENVKPPFKKITYNEALELLKENDFDIEWGEDFRTKEERFLTKDKKIPLIVEKFPLEAKAFYMKENPEDSETVLCNDILAPEGFGEIIGGSERETKNKILIERLKREGANLKDYEWYLDLRKYGSVPHSGFGLGIERLLRWICKLEHIRDAIPFPRTLNRYYP